MNRPGTAIFLLAAVVLATCSPRGDGQSSRIPTYCPTHLAQALEVGPETGNIAPRAYYQSLSTSEDTPLIVTLYACDPNDVTTSEGLSWMVDSSPLSGTLSTTAGIYPDALITYSPSRGFIGTASFTYHVNDGLLDGNSAEILVSVNPPAIAGSTWIKTYSLPNELWARGISPAGGGGYVLSGTNFKSTGTQVDFWAARLDEQGNVLWERTVGGNIGDYSFGLAATSDGGSILAGQTQSFGQGSADAWVVKLDSSGAVDWEKAFGSAIQDYSSAVTETVNALGLPDGYLVSGYRGSTVNDTADIVVWRLAADGTVVWQRSYDGGLNDTAIFSTSRQTADLGFIVAGSSASFAVSNYDAWFIKLTPSGTIEWQRAIGVPGNIAERIRSVRQSSDGGYILGGTTEEFDAEGDYWVVKLDNAGGITWQKSFGGGGVDEVYSAEETSDGGYLITGTSDSFSSNEDAWILKLDPDGAVMWQWLYDAGGGDKAEAGYQTPDAGYVIAGSTRSFTGDLEAWVLKLDANGQAGGSCDFGTSPMHTSSDTSAISTITSASSAPLGLVTEDTSATLSAVAGTTTLICTGQ